MNATGMSDEAAVFVIDDDDSVRKGLANLLRSAGHSIRTFTSGREFLEYSGDEPGCIILDLRMPETSGLELQATLAAQDFHPPIIFLSGHGDVPSTATALKKGAVDFLEKPVDADVLLAAVDDALQRDRDNRQQYSQQVEANTRLARLTAREFEILRHVIAGSLNKQIAWALDISEKTVKAHRARVMDKMAVQSVAELVRLVEKTGVRPADSPAPKVQ
jgi:FixJ family two-component response regulator